MKYFKSIRENQNINTFEIINQPKYKRIQLNTPTAIDKELINPNDISIANEFICNICESIPLDPVKCSKCNIIFCRQEFNHSLQYNRSCPRICIPSLGSLIVPNNLSITELNILARINIQCKCEFKDLTFSNIQSHFATCITNSQYSCLECNETKKDLGAIDNHVNQECPILFTTCEYCNINVRKTEREPHQKNCREICKNCKVLISKVKFSEHRLNDCPDNMKKYYDNLLAETRDKTQGRLKPYIEENGNLICENKALLDYFNKCKYNYDVYENMIAEMDEYVENNVNSLESEYNDIIDKFGSRWNNGEVKPLWKGYWLYFVLFVVFFLYLIIQDNKKFLNLLRNLT
jgi:hypothetical protein